MISFQYSLIIDFQTASFPFGDSLPLNQILKNRKGNNCLENWRFSKQSPREIFFVNRTELNDNWFLKVHLHFCPCDVGNDSAWKLEVAQSEIAIIMRSQSDIRLAGGEGAKHKIWDHNWKIIIRFGKLAITKNLAFSAPGRKKN